jgi:hypothetical protein
MEVWTLIKGLFGLVDLFKRLVTFIQLRQAKQEGRVEQAFEQEKSTIEVIARNLEGQQSIDNMTEAELNDYLSKP